MPKRSKEGDVNVAQNGYHYTHDGKHWRLTHHLIAEKDLGRRIDGTRERVYFIDGDRNNLDPTNIEVRPIKKGREYRKEEIKLRIQVLQEELDALESS